MGLADGYPYKTNERDESSSIIIKILVKLKKLLGIRESHRTMLLRRLLRHYKIEQCYAEFGPVGVGALSACKSENIRLIVNFHGYDAFKYETIEKYAKEYRSVFEYASTVICVSNSMLEQLVNLGCPREKLLCLPCYPAPKFSEFTYNADEKVVSFIGRFVEKKAPWITLIAFKKVLETHPDAQLVMAGDGPLLPICKSLAVTLEVKNVEFLGSITHSSVEKLLKKTMVYVQHSIIASSGDREGTPVSIMEAMLAGIPVVSTKHEGIADIIENNTSGILVEENDATAMANAITKILNEPVLREQLSKQGKIRIESKLRDGNNFFVKEKL